MGPPSWSARTPPANAAMAPAAARPVPSRPTTRPRSRAGYIAPHRRRWNGPPNEMLSQKMSDTAIMTAAVGQRNSSSSDAAPMPRMTASWAVERGPNRPANAPSRLATNGAAASAASPIGSRPPRRAMVGSSVVTSAALTPTPTAAIRSRARFRPTSRWVGDGRSDGRSTRYLEAGPLGLRGELTGSAWVSPSRSVRVSPQGGGSPVLIEEVRPSPMLPAAERSGPMARWSGGRRRRRCRRRSGR